MDPWLSPGKMSAADLAAYVGAAGAVIGLLITWYYKREANGRQAKEYERRESERQMRMDVMRATGVPVFHEDTDLGRLEVDE